MDVAAGVALITGGASGLGLATAERLAAAGAAVVIADLGTSAGGQAAKRLGERAAFVAADVTDTGALTAAFDVADSLGPLRILVTCAGIGTPGRVLGRDGEPMPMEQFARVIGVNLLGTFNAVRLGAQRMARHEPVDGDRGVIVCTASAAAYEGQIGQAAYSASKGGVVGMILPIARDLAARAIRVMAIAPGLFDTPLLAELPDEVRDSLGAQVPHPSRLGRPEEYAALVEHIVSNPMLNGEVIRLDGAIRMAPR